MSRFRDVFSHRHVVLPIIHVTTSEQVLRNMHTSMTGGQEITGAEPVANMVAEFLATQKFI